jgi:hypothetical protein
MIRKVLYWLMALGALLGYDWVRRNTAVPVNVLTWIFIIGLGALVIIYKLKTKPAKPEPPGKHTSRAVAVNFKSSARNYTGAGRSADTHYVAAHEMGHVVAFWSADIHVSSVEAHHRWGVTWIHPPKDMPRSQRNGYMMATYAGQEAGARHLVEYHGMGWAEARERAYAGGSQDQADAKADRKLFEDLTAHQEAARKFVDKHWSEIDRMSKQLARKGHMTF